MNGTAFQSKSKQKKRESQKSETEKLRVSETKIAVSREMMVDKAAGTINGKSKRYYQSNCIEFLFEVGIRCVCVCVCCCIALLCFYNIKYSKPEHYVFYCIFGVNDFLQLVNVIHSLNAEVLDV